MRILRFILLCAVVQVAAAQQQSTFATVQGIVVQAGTNTPIPNARVDLHAFSGAATDDGLPPPSITTGSDGRFQLNRIPPGTYRIVATKPGYAEASYGQTQSN